MRAEKENYNKKCKNNIMQINIRERNKEINKWKSYLSDSAKAWNRVLSTK